MMAKYQLVFSKIECSAMKVLNSNRGRERKAKQQAFYKLVSNARQKSQHIRMRTVLVAQTVQLACSKIVTTVDKF
jgi:hypothetical protein